MFTIALRPRLRVIGCPKDIEKRLIVPLSSAAMLVQTEAKVWLSVPGGDASPGEGWPTYFNPQLKKWVEASIPSDPPHRQTGFLQNSIKRTKLSASEMAVVAGAHYSAVLEYGTGKMEGPRPFMRPALLSTVNQIAKTFYKFLGA
jgi:HK97 gp10 family phage protein